MDKKSANGFQTPASEGGVQRKQLPYSVETPYGFHLDLDFLKYVDDIEKGNTIKRVHIQRRVKGPPKFSTLPRNFSLPGHGVRPLPKEKDSVWSGTSTLGPKPKSRVTEVQQIFDFRASEGGTSSQSSRGSASPGSGYVSPKPREEVSAAARAVEDKNVEAQSRPNLLRASSMPITLQQRKGSDSSSPDRTLGTPENGSTENMFRASPDITERRCVPQDRTGLHQQITVALKRVRELEEQVKTIPELKAQICSLREERVQLLLQLQAQAQVSKTSPHVPASSDARTKTKVQGQRPSEGLNLPLVTQPTGDSDVSGSAKAVTDKTVLPKERKSSSAQGEMDGLRETLPSEKTDKHKEDAAVQKLSQGIAGQELATHTAAGIETQGGNAAKEGQLEESDTMQKLQEKLRILEIKLTQASQELERTNSRLKEQIEENKVKEEKILQLSEGMRVEVCTTESHDRPRRESIDAGTVTERIEITNQETETESPGTVDQGTDTDKICIEVFVPKPTTGSIDQETNEVNTQSQVTEMEVELPAGSPPRPRANSMERGTVTETIVTQDQTTETPVAERVNQVTETEGETVTDHPHRPRASSVDRGTETERVDTVDRVTETEAAQRTDQETETETERRHDNNPARGAGAGSQVVGIVQSQREDVGTAVDGGLTDQEDTETDVKDSESVVVDVCTQSSAVESVVVETVVSDVSTNKESSSLVDVIGETKITVTPAQDDTKTKEVVPPKSVEKEIVDRKQQETKEQKASGEEEVMCATIQETVVTDTVVVTVETPAVKTVAPVRPQRGRKPSAEQVQPSPSQPLAAPVRPRRGSSETKAKQVPPPTQAQATTKVQPPTQAQAATQAATQVQPPTQAQATTQVQPPTEAQAPTQATTQVQPPTEAQEPTQAPTKVQSPTQPQATTQVQPPTQAQSTTQATTKVQPPTEAQAPTQATTQVKPLTQPQVEGQPQAPVESAPAAETTVQSSEPQVDHQTPSVPQVEETTQAKKVSEGSREKQPPTQPPTSSSEVQVRPKSIQAKSQTSTTRRNSKEVKAPQRGSSVSHAPRRGSGEVQTRPSRQASSDQSQRRSSGESQPPQKDAAEARSLRRGSSEAGQRRGSSEASRRDSGEAQPRRGSSESPTSPAALGQVVTRLTGLLGEQWAQLGSGSGAQQTASQQESSSAQKQTTGKRAEAGKGASAKPSGKAAPAAATAKPAGKPGPSKMSSIQSQLVSSLSVLSAFYSPAQKAAAASKQQEQGLKSIMKKNGVADKQGSKGAKKNLKFVGVNGGYETTSSEESSGDEKSKVEVEKTDSPEPKMEEEAVVTEKEPEEAAEQQGREEEEEEVSAEGGGGAAAEEKEPERGLMDPESCQELLEEEEEAEGEKVDKGFIDACIYVKDRMEEVSSPDKEMRQVLVVLYKEWFKVSSQKESQVDTVRLYLRQVGRTTPTLLPYVVNLTDGNGNMALHYSVSHSNFPVVRLLLDTGLCETDNVNKAGYTPVMLAALTAADSPDDLEVAQQLLRLGDVNARSRQAGQTALMLAVSHGRVAMVKLLLSSGVDVNAQDREGSTALMCASEHGHTHIARLLLETGRCDTALTDKNGQTALSVAEGASHQEVIDLLKAHADPGASESPPAS